MNELIFLLQILTVCVGFLGAYKLGPYALVSFVCLCSVLSNFFVLKQISLFGLSVTAADAFVVGAMLALNMLQETEGEQRAQKAVIISFWGLVFYTAVTQLHLAYTPSTYDTTAAAYTTLLHVVPRLTLASLAAYFISQKLNIFLYALARARTHRFLLVRNYATLLISQLADTMMFAFLGLAGLVPNLWTIILFSLSVKVITISLATPCVVLTRFR